MADTKTSELSIITALQDDMFFPCIVPDGLGGWLDFRISWQTIKGETLTNDNIKRGVSSVPLGENKIPFGSDFANNGYSLSYNVYDSLGQPSFATLGAKDTDGFYLNNEFGQILTVSYIAVL